MPWPKSDETCQHESKRSYTVHFKLHKNSFILNHLITHYNQDIIRAGIKKSKHTDTALTWPPSKHPISPLETESPDFSLFFSHTVFFLFSSGLTRTNAFQVLLYNTPPPPLSTSHLNMHRATVTYIRTGFFFFFYIYTRPCIVIRIISIIAMTGFKSHQPSGGLGLTPSFLLFAALHMNPSCDVWRAKRPKISPHLSSALLNVHSRVIFWCESRWSSILYIP